MADEAAKAAVAEGGTNLGLTYKSICSMVRASFKDPPIQHQRTMEVYSALNPEREKLVKSREDQTLLAKLRSGKYIGLRAYKHTIDPNTDPTCNLCGLAPQDLRHWLLECPAIEQKRRALLGPDPGGLDCLTRCPLETVTLVRSTLLGV